MPHEKVESCLASPCAGTVYSMEWSLGAELWSGVLEWSGVKLWSGINSFTESESVYLTFSNIWTGLFLIDIRHLQV